MRLFWSPGEAAQADYERLRAAVLAGIPIADVAATRFARGGLAALIGSPTADPVFIAIVAGAKRPSWSPHHDPRTEALVAGYELLLLLDIDHHHHEYQPQEAAQ